LQIKGIRIYVVIVTIVVTLCVLLSIQYINQKYNIEQPLFKLYSQTKLVKGVKIENRGTDVNVILDVKKTDNLRQVYKDLTNYTEQIMGTTKFSVELKDNRNKTLENVYYQSQFIIYEALAKGDFSKMATVIEKNARDYGAEAKVFMDEDSIYVEIIKGDNYLYEIIPREHVEKGDLTGQTGSEQI
jgi:hypothetical protein